MSRLRAQNMTMPATEPSRAAERSAAAVGTVVGAVVVPLDGVLVTTASVVVGEAVPKLVSRCSFFVGGFPMVTYQSRRWRHQRVPGQRCCWRGWRWARW